MSQIFAKKANILGRGCISPFIHKGFMQLFKFSNFLSFYLRAFTQRRKAAKVAQRKAKEKLCGNFASLRLCGRSCFFGSGLSGL
jgi:hypothetical protein